MHPGGRPASAATMPATVTVPGLSASLPAGESVSNQKWAESACGVAAGTNLTVRVAPSPAHRRRLLTSLTFEFEFSLVLGFLHIPPRRAALDLDDTPCIAENRALF